MATKALKLIQPSCVQPALWLKCPACAGVVFFREGPIHPVDIPVIRNQEVIEGLERVCKDLVSYSMAPVQDLPDVLDAFCLRTNEALRLLHCVPSPFSNAVSVLTHKLLKGTVLMGSA